jgi:hypothetical protein
MKVMKAGPASFECINLIERQHRATFPPSSPTSPHHRHQKVAGRA